jgi:lactate dehydrogenase-like 2-hydroxyacid dehydrogenase
MGIAGKTARFVEGGIADDERKFSSFGIDALEAESLPYYARWMRQDLVGVFFLTSHIAFYSRIAVILLALIAIPLWIIALK